MDTCTPAYAPTNRPYAAKRVYGAILGVYSKLCLFAGDYFAVFQNGDRILMQSGDNLIFNG